MVKIMKRNMRSLVFLLMIALVALGFLGTSFVVPVGARVDSNESQTRTKSHPGTGGSSTKAPAVCRKRCDKAYSDCLVPGPAGIVFVEQCGGAHTQCLRECSR